MLEFKSRGKKQEHEMENLRKDVMMINWDRQACVLGIIEHDNRCGWYLLCLRGKK